MSQKRLLIIDDEENMRHMLSAMLSRKGYSLAAAPDGVTALEMMAAEQYDFVLCDIKMPNMDGLTFLEKALAMNETATIIMMSAYGTIDTAVKAMKLGAYDYISKPFKADEINLILQKAEERENLLEENVHLKQRLAAVEVESGFGAMVAKSKAMQDLFQLAHKVAQHKTTVLITGESGTGKELLAKAIHDKGVSAGKPFVAVNCGGVPESLLESEFFGYRKGAFTGADTNKKGLFTEAGEGTIFLDEIGELPLSLQVNLLRVLQENELRPVGSSKVEKVNARVIAATARNLEKEVEKGVFRKDLFFRLNVMPLHIAPLRDRKEDLLPLCDHLLVKLNKQLGRTVNDISPSAVSVLLQHDWPGNVRELENVLERAIILAEKDIILPENLPLNFGAQMGGRRMDDFFNTFSLKKAKKILEERLISRALGATGGNKSKAASLLELSYPSLLSKIKEFDIKE